MANFCNNCSGCNGCGSAYNRGRGCRRNTYAALNSLPRCSACMNYPYYTGRCPDAYGCYNCGCHAGVSTQNTPEAFYNNCGACTEDCCCDNNAHGNTCGCNNGCNDGCNGCETGCGCNTGYARNNCLCGNCCDNNARNNACGCNNGRSTGCGCCSCCNNGCECNLPAPVYGMFTAAAPLSVSSGTGIPLTSGTGTGDFTAYGGNITIQQPGTYLATLTLQIPGDTAADGVLNLNLNGSALPSARIAFNSTTGDGNAAAYSSQTIFTASEGALLSLTSDSAFSITGVSGQNLITLTLVRLGE